MCGNLCWFSEEGKRTEELENRGGEAEMKRNRQGRVLLGKLDFTRRTIWRLWRAFVEKLITLITFDIQNVAYPCVRTKGRKMKRKGLVFMVIRSEIVGPKFGEPWLEWGDTDGQRSQEVPSPFFREGGIEEKSLLLLYVLAGIRRKKCHSLMETQGQREGLLWTCHTQRNSIKKGDKIWRIQRLPRNSTLNQKAWGWSCGRESGQGSMVLTMLSEGEGWVARAKPTVPSMAVSNLWSVVFYVPGLKGLHQLEMTIFSTMYILSPLTLHWGLTTSKHIKTRVPLQKTHVLRAWCSLWKLALADSTRLFLKWPFYKIYSMRHGKRLPISNNIKEQ